MKTTVLFVLSTLERTGPVNLTYDVIRYLDVEIYQVKVLTLSKEKSSSRWDDFASLPNVEVFTTGLSNRANPLRLGRFLQSFCSQHMPDIIHSQGFRSDILSTLFLKKYSRVYNIQSYAYDDYSMLFGISGSLIAFLHLWFLRKEKTIVACSNYIATRISSHVKAEVEVVQNGTSTGFQRVNPNTSTELKESLELEPNSRIFLFAGPLIQRKNPLFLIEVVKELGDPNIVLLLLGDGPLRGLCEDASEGIKQVKILGMVDDVSKYMQISDYYITASLSEGMPTSVLEAMNHGLPVLLSNIPQHAEVLENFPMAGLLFDHNDALDLSAKILETFNNDYGMMSRAAMEAVEKQFSANRMSHGFQKIYKTII